MAKLNIITLGSSKNYTDLAALGLTNVVVNDQDKTISFTLVADGSTRTLHFDQPSDGKDGIGISKIEKIGTVDLVDTYRITFTDNSTFDYEVKNGKNGADGQPGQDGFSPTITENADNTDKIYKLDITTADSTFTTPNLKGADGQGGTGGSGEENTIESISVNGTPISVDENKNVDITVPSIDGLAKTEDIPTKVSELTNDSGYLTEHQDISGKVDKVDGKSLIADTEIERLASVDNYDDTQVKTQIQAVANGLMDSVGYSADYKTIDIIAKNGVKKSVNVAPIISHASITELSDVDTTNKATGKALVYNATTSKHEYADVSGTDEKVKMDASTDAKYLGELLDNITIANENGELKVKKLDGQDVTITEINYLKGLTMNVMDLVNMFSNGGVKIINTPVATYAELLTIDKSSFIDGISYLVYVLADENYDNAKTTYLVDKVSETPTYFGFADSHRDFTTNPIDLATEITGKLGISNMDSDAIKALFTVDDTYKTETATNNAFSTHGAKALYDELLLAIGNKANSSDLTAHKNDTDIHVSTEDRTNWNSAKIHADSAHAPSNAQANVIETVKVNGTALTPSGKAVNVTVPTTVAQLTDSSSYAKKTDIPTTLPANGGNANTVNNHTVESDVPVDAKFTDTVYDDTEVKGSIAKLSNNLDTLEYSEISGGKNLLHVNDIVLLSPNYWFDNTYITLKPNTYYCISYTSTNSGFYQLISDEFGIDDVNNISVGRNTIRFYTGSNTNGKLRLYINGTGTFSNFMLEEGTEATDYEPYIPSVKMLAEEVSAQNENLAVQKLGNDYDGVLSTGYYDAGGNAQYANDWLKTNKHSCNAGDTVSFAYGRNAETVHFVWFNASGGFISREVISNTVANTKTVKIAPTNAKSVVIDIKEKDGVEVTPSNASSFYLYINNAIDELKNDLVEQKMLGWNVPSEFPIQNEVSGNQFIQKVDRVDLSELVWLYATNPSRFLFYLDNIKSCDAMSIANVIVTDKLSVTTFNDVYTHASDNILGVSERNVGVYASSYTDVESFKNAMKGVYLYYELDTPITITIDGNEVTERINESLSVIGKCKNLLKPTLQTTTQNGVTCTNNGDGTFTVNGTVDSEKYPEFPLGMITLDKGKYLFPNQNSSAFLWCGTSKASHNIVNSQLLSNIFINIENKNDIYITLVCRSGETYDNVVIKPMITTDLTATYDDFVPYTGDGETLASDVAEIKNDLGGLTFSASGTTLTITDGTNTWTLGANS